MSKYVFNLGKTMICKKHFHRVLVVVLLLNTSLTKADEGMWLPMLIGKYNYSTMQQMGLKLTADQIYDINKACLKDAIIALDHGGCTGSVISDKGLIITNHHCGYDDIAAQSSTNSDYLTEGFWASRPEEELPIYGKTVSFLIRMEDVTQQILSKVNSQMTESERISIIEAFINDTTSQLEQNNDYEVSIESMFSNNEYYLFVYQTFNDVRMVAAPPSSIGKFGGDTDNWMWPRHTGDFCLLRVYAGSDGRPASYHKENKPLKAKYILPVSLNGIKEGDFSMILGYPGSTDRYLTSEGINLKLTQTNPADIKAKWTRMEVLKKYMDADAATRIAYAGDYAYLGNFWKKSLQESKALSRLKVADDKKAVENQFSKWIENDTALQRKYGNVLPDLTKYYEQSKKNRADEAMVWIGELLMGSKLLNIAFQSGELLNYFDSVDFKNLLADHLERDRKFFNSFNPQLEKEELIAMLEKYRQNVSETYLPDIYKVIDKKYKGNIETYVNHVFDKSIFVSFERTSNFLNKPRKKTLIKDPALVLAASFIQSYMVVHLTQMTSSDDFEHSRRLLLEGLRQMQPNKVFYPDANSTMRLTYGTVQKYQPADGLTAEYFTTLKGVMDKEDPDNEEFIVPEKLKQLYASKDFGVYGSNGCMPVCFLTTHDITGGNSGSPVINANGELIGLAFDGNSEAMSSDIKYDVNLQRTICVDIRYVLFIIDKFAGARWLVEEINPKK